MTEKGWRNFVFSTSAFENNLQEHYPGAKVKIIRKSLIPWAARKMHVVHEGKVLARISLDHLGEGKDPLVRTGQNITLIKKNFDLLENIMNSMLKAHKQMNG